MSFGPPPSMTEPPPTARAHERARERKVLTALLVVVVASALCTGGWLLWGGGSTDGTPSDKPPARILAKGINKTLVGMRIGTDVVPGEEEWRLGLDGPICG